jgi:hypothetical protein
MEEKDFPSEETPSIESSESEKIIFRFDIKSKHPKSDLIGDNPLNRRILLKEAENPFNGLNGKKITYNGEEIGVLRVMAEALPQCLFAINGSPMCGWFYQIEADLTSKGLEKSTAKNIILNAIDDNIKIDYMCIETRKSLKDGGLSIEEEETIDTTLIKRDKSIL